MQRLFLACALTTTLLILGCGKDEVSIPSDDGSASNGNGSSPSSPAGGGSSGNSNGQVSANHSRYVNAAQQAARLLGEMSSEYESLANSGQSSIQIERTPKLVEQLDTVSSDVSSLGAPTLADARKLKANVLPQLVRAIKTARLAETHLEQKYRIMFSFSRGREIGSGVRTANSLLSRFQQNLPLAERLTIGAPPTIGSRPAANVSFGELTNLGFNADNYQNSRAGGGAPKEMIPWQVAVDPPIHDATLPADVRLDIEIPHAAVKGAFRSEPVKLLYPATPSVHVAVGLNQIPSQSRHVWDLKARRRLGSIKGLQMKASRWLALSPDGKFFAGRPAGANVVGIWDVDAGKAVQTVSLPVTGEPSLLEFGADNRIIAVVDKMLYVLSTQIGRAHV